MSDTTERDTQPLQQSPGPDWCYAHNRSEPLTATTYRVCGECFHCFETVTDLEQADYALQVRLIRSDLDRVEDSPVRRAVGLIFACPECSHDF